MIQPSPAWSAPHPDAIVEAQKTNWVLMTLAGLVAAYYVGSGKENEGNDSPQARAVDAETGDQPPQA